MLSNFVVGKHFGTFHLTHYLQRSQENSEFHGWIAYLKTVPTDGKVVLYFSKGLML